MLIINIITRINLGAFRQESAPQSAPNHIRGTLSARAGLSLFVNRRARILAGQKKGLTRAIIRHGKNKIGGKCMKKKKSIISGLLIAVLLLLVIGCDTGGGGSNPAEISATADTTAVTGGGGSNPAVTYAIGDTGPSGVGIVFYVTDGGLHGLEVAPVDQSTSQVWIRGGSTQTTKNGNTSTAIGTGLANSNAIIDQTGHTGSAAQVCRSYNGGGLTDWYLPSKDELNAIWDNLVDDGTGVNSGVGGFASAFYWSSTEYYGSYAWYQSFDYGPQYYYGKTSPNRVRAVRAF